MGAVSMLTAGRDQDEGKSTCRGVSHHLQLCVSPPGDPVHLHQPRRGEVPLDRRYASAGT